MELVRRLQLRSGASYERYQQFFGSRNAQVLGGQITVYRDSSGSATSVIGSHYSGIAPKNSVAVSKGGARRTVERDIGTSGTRIADLLINPSTGRYFYRVETRRFASRWIHWIDAGSGAVIKRFNAIADDHGIGVKSDTKDINGPDNASTADDLTTFHNSSGHGASGPHWDLISKDNRQTTYDARNKSALIYNVTDLDNHWLTSGRTSPGQPAMVDAQYYANVTDDYYQTRHGLSWTSCYPSGMQSVAHYKRNYANAFWNGTYTIFGDGDGSSYREFSGGLDVVAHENTHAVTDCTSKLLYLDESGALNESFSDIMGSSTEFFANEPTSSNCRLATGQTACSDWWVAEDVSLAADAVPGFRNMADPREDGDPDHYSERQIGGGDNGGVHTNSGIPNHAYYLLVAGGKNAGCDSVGSGGHTHTADCNVTVTGIGVADAERIFFEGFTSLPQNATMCQARAATQARASADFGPGSQQAQSTKAAWDAVGVPSDCISPPATSYRDTVLGDSPALYWRLGEASGTNANDETANNRDGTYVGSPTLGVAGAIAGDSDTAVDVNGSSQYISSTYSPFVNGTVRTFEGWAYRDTSANYDALFGGTGTPYTNSLFLRLGFGNQNVEFQADIAGSTTTWTGAWPGNGQWVHWALVFNEAANSVELFINGASQGAQPLFQQYNAAAGNFEAGAWTGGGDPFDGRMDEVAVYEYALSAQQILEHYLAGT
jgi:Zn-dependent metalloprotease